MQLRLCIWSIWFDLFWQFFSMVFFLFLLVNKCRGEYMGVTSCFLFKIA
jgi:hypothetical protein